MNEERLMYARCLDYLILEATSNEGPDLIPAKITHIMANAGRLNDMTKLDIDHLFRVRELTSCKFFKQNGFSAQPLILLPGSSFCQD
jgi:hypothetical protein